MSLTVTLAAALATAAPNAAAQPRTVTVEVAPPGSEAKDAKAADPMAEIGAMMKIMDRMFPAGPEPDPARLAAARGTALMMFPNGTYGNAMTSFLDGMANRILDMSEADFAAMFPETEKDEEPKGKKGAKAKKEAKPKKPPSTEPLRVTLARDDPSFDAKYAAIRAFMMTTFKKVGDKAEPKFREGMARAMARKFDTAQLAQINAFLATPAGAAFGRQTVGMWFEPDVIRGTIQLLPEMMAMLPELMGDAAALDAVMKPKGKPAAKK